MATHTYHATASQPRSTALVPPLSQNTAPVFEFRCLFTHDIRRKNTKRWHDGFLRYHTFNKRVMVYDMPNRILVGDSYMRDRDMVEDGDEFSLERSGALIQVGEQIGSENTDLTVILDRERRQAETAMTSNIVRTVPGRSVNPSSRKTPTTPQARPGSRIVAGPIRQTPTSPFEARKARGDRIERPTKRQRNDEDHVPLCEILKSTRPTKANTVPSAAFTNATDGSRQNILYPAQKRTATKAPERHHAPEVIQMTLSRVSLHSGKPAAPQASTPVSDPPIDQNPSGRPRTEIAPPKRKAHNQNSHQKPAKRQASPSQSLRTVQDASAPSDIPPHRPASLPQANMDALPRIQTVSSIEAARPVTPAVLITPAAQIESPRVTITGSNLQQLRIKSRPPRKMLFCQDLPPRKAKKKSATARHVSAEKVEARTDSESNEVEMRAGEQSTRDTTDQQQFASLPDATNQATTPQEDKDSNTAQIPPSQDHHHPDEQNNATSEVPDAAAEDQTFETAVRRPALSLGLHEALDKVAPIPEQPSSPPIPDHPSESSELPSAQLKSHIPSPKSSPVQITTEKPAEQPTTTSTLPSPVPTVPSIPDLDASPAPDPAPAAITTLPSITSAAQAPVPAPAPTGLQKPFSITRPTAFSRTVMPKAPHQPSTTAVTRASTRLAALANAPADTKRAETHAEEIDIAAVEWDETGPWTVEAWDLLGWIPPSRKRCMVDDI